MKICCCLCFTFGDEEEAPSKAGSGRGRAMEDGIFVNDDNFESGNVGIDDEEAEEAATRLRLALDDSVPERDEQDSLRLFEEMKVTCGGCVVTWDAAPDDVVRAVGPLSLRGAGIQGSWQPAGESSTSSTTAAAAVTVMFDEECDRDSHNKRAKVDTFSIRDGRDESGTAEDLEVQMDLMDDLLHMVFSFLDQINLCRAAMVCRQWRAASAHEDFWTCLDFKNRNISVEEFEDMCQRHPNAVEVNVFGAPAIHLLVMKALSSLRNLEVLTLGRGQLGDPFFYALPECSMLKCLNINDAILCNSIQEIPINHDRLCHLQLTKCRVMRIYVRCPQLETLSLKRSNMAQAVLNCPLLHLLDIGSCHKLSDVAIRAAVVSCPQLELLDISNCSCVSDETLHEIALTCANLHILDASYCPNVSLESVRLPMLTVLKLHSCDGITSASMAAISHSHLLEMRILYSCICLPRSLL
uniref:F-box domain-containing protein n=1 Tax=Rhizophora mucronata TaxID=61149 RepID=A0A2P2MDR1_RHIMU